MKCILDFNLPHKSFILYQSFNLCLCFEDGVMYTSTLRPNGVMFDAVNRVIYIHACKNIRADYYLLFIIYFPRKRCVNLFVLKEQLDFFVICFILCYCENIS